MKTGGLGICRSGIFISEDGRDAFLPCPETHPARGFGVRGACGWPGVFPVRCLKTDLAQGASFAFFVWFLSSSERARNSGLVDAGFWTVTWTRGCWLGGEIPMSESPGTMVVKLEQKKRPYYRPTTADQRKQLFRAYEETSSVSAATAAAHVGKSTFYYWRKRFEAGGYAALEVVGSHRPHSSPRQLPAEIVGEVKAAKEEHPDWGRQRIADEIRKAHGWVPMVSASEVRRILVRAGLWTKVAQRPKGVAASATPRSQTRR